MDRASKLKFNWCKQGILLFLNWWFAAFLVIAVCSLFPVSLFAQGWGFSPTAQVGQNFGTRGTSHALISVGALLESRLNVQGQNFTYGASLLYVPADVMSLGGKVGGYNLDSHGNGFELSTHNHFRLIEWEKYGTLSWRKLRFDRTHDGKHQGTAEYEALYLGWSLGKTVLWSMGGSWAFLSLPKEYLQEFQLQLALSYTY